MDGKFPEIPDTTAYHEASEQTSRKPGRDSLRRAAVALALPSLTNFSRGDTIIVSV
jgi:hypothetical protein